MSIALKKVLNMDVNSSSFMRKSRIISIQAVRVNLAVVNSSAFQVTNVRYQRFRNSNDHVASNCFQELLLELMWVTHCHLNKFRLTFLEQKPVANCVGSHGKSTGSVNHHVVMCGLSILS